MEKLLEVKDLKVSFFTDLGETQAVKGAGIAIGEGDLFGIVGESGSGKSETTKSILRLGPSNCKIMGGEILFRGEDILKKNEAELREIRGGEIAMIFQDSLSALNPVYTVGNKMVELIRRHTNMNKKEAKARVLELLTAVGITDPEKAMNSYPHELSGGMRQRVMIAMAMSSDPKILIADEPTTALDVTIQAQIIALIRDLQKELKFTTIYITHDLGVVANVADRVGGMDGGQIIEYGNVEEAFFDPRHPYTWALLSSLPQLGIKGQELYYITGTPPSLYNQIKGDAFAPRNEHALKIDFEMEPPFFPVSEPHYAKPWLLGPRAPKLEKPEILQNLHEKIKQMTDKGGAFHVE